MIATFLSKSYRAEIRVHIQFELHRRHRQKLVWKQKSAKIYTHKSTVSVCIMNSCVCECLFVCHKWVYMNILLLFSFHSFGWFFNLFCTIFFISFSPIIFASFVSHFFFSLFVLFTGHIETDKKNWSLVLSTHTHTLIETYSIQFERILCARVIIHWNHITSG